MPMLDERTIFDAARRIEAPAARLQYVKQACADNHDLLVRVEALLHAHDDEGSFLGAAAVPLLEMAVEVHERPGGHIGPYNLIEQIGEGGFGIVFLAEQQQPVRRKVALKVLKPGMDTRQVAARFEAERQALALMDHPNIAHVFDGGTTEAGRPYFVMELVRGVPITEFCDENRLAMHERLALFIDVCQAVQHAHQKGIIHRDIKPSNVLVTLRDGAAVIKVIDFGIAKALGQQLTEKTLLTNMPQLIGTPLYMSPEQAELNGLDIDTRSDIYSLGVLLYELVTGTTPFESDLLRKVGYDEMRRIIREDEPPKPSARISTIGKAAATVGEKRQINPRKFSGLFRAEIDWIVMKALEKDRDRRYETASALVLDIKHYLNDEPVVACPPSFGYRLRKFARRNKRTLATAALVAAVLLVAVASIGWTIGWAIRDRAARQAAADRKVQDALKDAVSWREQRKWPKSLSAVKRAEAFLGSGSSESLRAHVHLVRRDVEIAMRLEEARLHFLDAGIYASASMDLDAFCLKAFRDDGIDLEALPATSAAELIRGRAVQEVLAGALDTWAAYTESKDLKSKILAIAKEVDSDEWRNRLRDALVAGGDGRRLSAELAASHRPLPPYTLCAIAKALRDAGLFDDGIALLRAGQQDNPEDFWITFTLAEALSRTGRSDARDEAIRFYAMALGQRPRSVSALTNLGSQIRAKGQVAEAIPFLRTAIEIDPGYAAPHWELGDALAKTGELDEAIVHLEKAAALDPRSAWYSYGLARGYAQIGQWNEAASEFDRTVELDATNHSIWMRAAALHAALGEVESYRRTCHAMLARFGDTDQPMIAERSAKACLLLAEVLSADDLDFVQKLADRAVNGTESDPSYHFFAMAKGLAEYRAGHHHGAVEWMQRSGPRLNGMPWDATKFSVLALARQGLGQVDEARAALGSAQAILTKMPDTARGEHFGGDWFDWLHARTICREAESLIEEP